MERNKSHDNIITSILIKSGKILVNSTRKIYKGEYPNIYEYLINRYDDSDNIAETLWRMFHKVEERPTCKVCGGHVYFIGHHHGKLKYTKTCSISCGSRSSKPKREQTMVDRYGVKSNFQSEVLREKSKQTWLKKYGVDNPAKSGLIQEKIKQTCLRKYGVTCMSKADSVKEKAKQTCLEKYGVDNYVKTDEFKEKFKQTCLEKYGVESPMKSAYIRQKSKETCLKKYNGTCSFTSKELRNKIKSTMIERYGVEYSMQIPKNREYMAGLYASGKIQQKRYETMKKNGTFNTSQPEEDLYSYIKEKFPLVERQYKCDRYPYHCDFYIPELDLFLELQGYYTHGRHPYDPDSIEDQNLVKKYRDKYGDDCQAITIWTGKDVEKRNVAKQNNLNFKEVWSLSEGKEFVDYISNTNNKNNK